MCSARRASPRVSAAAETPAHEPPRTGPEGTRDGSPTTGNSRLRRRRQEHPDRPAPLRLEVDLRGSTRIDRGHLRRAGRRAHQPGAAHRRPPGRTGAGHHHRRRLSLLHHAPPQVHHRRHPGSHPVHPQHGHRRLHRRSGHHPGRCPQGTDRAVTAPLVHRQPAPHPPPGAGHQQDGPRRPRPGDLRADPGRVHRVRLPARRPRSGLHPDVGPTRRQRRRPLGQHGLVQRRHPPPSPGGGLHRFRPQHGRRALPGAVRDPPPEHRTPRLPGLRRHRRRWCDEAGRRGRGSAVGFHHQDRRHHRARRPGRPGHRADVGGRAIGGRARRQPGRHAVPDQQPARRDPGPRGHGLLDVRHHQTHRRLEARHQTHHQVGESLGQGPPLPARTSTPCTATRMPTALSPSTRSVGSASGSPNRCSPTTIRSTARPAVSSWSTRTRT